MCVQMSSDLCVRRRRFIRVLKPLLARKRSSSARINLNRHWNELEELYSRPAATTESAVHFDTLLLHNELNDNAVNEAREAAAAAAAAAVAAVAAATTAITKTKAAAFPAKALLPADSTPPAEDEELLTPPATPCRAPAAYPVFDFGSLVMEDDIAGLPLTPITPQAWDVFTFPSQMQQGRHSSTADASTSRAAGHHDGAVLS